MRTLADLDFHGKKVLMRVDFNTPLKNGVITDDTRIKSSLPSIRWILDHGGSLILVSHLGRPKGKVDPNLSLAPIARHLQTLLEKPVLFATDCIGNETVEKASHLSKGEVLLLENVRFHPGEENPEKEPFFTKALASLGDLYVNDAFGSLHRAHASTTLIASYFPGKTASGLLLEKEIAFLKTTFQDPKRPFVAIIGGAKISTKMGLLHALLTKVDSVLIGGAMAFTFLKAMGKHVGASLVEDSLLNEASSILASFQENKIPLLLPVDCVITKEGKPSTTVSIEDGIPEGFQGVDVGPSTLEQFFKVLDQAKTIFWNGPLGVFEIPSFSKGTFACAQKLASLQDATTIVGGGDSVAAIMQSGLADKISHISTGGGAALEYIEYGTLPGIDALEKTT